MKPILVPIKKLRRLCPIFTQNPWYLQDRKKLRNEVKKRIRYGKFCDIPFDTYTGKEYDHAARIAYLIINKDSKPIEIDLGVPALNCFCNWPIIDGNHRFAAAIFRKEEFIKAKVSGQVCLAKKMLGVEI